MDVPAKVSSLSPSSTRVLSSRHAARYNDCTGRPCRGVPHLRFGGMHRMLASAVECFTSDQPIRGRTAQVGTGDLPQPLGATDLIDRSAPEVTPYERGDNRPNGQCHEDDKRLLSSLIHNSTLPCHITEARCPLNGCGRLRQADSPFDRLSKKALHPSSAWA